MVQLIKTDNILFEFLISENFVQHIIDFFFVSFIMSQIDYLLCEMIRKGDLPLGLK